MADTTISVSVKGLLGLDDPDRMRDELETATGLAWRQEPVDDGKVLSGGIVELLLVAAAGKATEMAVSSAVDAVKRVVDRWRGQSLDPPRISVGTHSSPDGDSGDDSEDDSDEDSGVDAAGPSASEGSDG